MSFVTTPPEMLTSVPSMADAWLLVGARRTTTPRQHQYREESADGTAA
jgi:hypothetical protein